MNDKKWKWVAEDVVLAVHDEQIAQHGGLTGVRDLALIQSALARPKNTSAYREADVAALAAAYAYGIARNHGFSDGNKRTAFVVAYVFLLDNGYRLTASDPDAIRIMLATAAGELTEPELATWFRDNVEAS